MPLPVLSCAQLCYITGGIGKAAAASPFASLDGCVSVGIRCEVACMQVGPGTAWQVHRLSLGPTCRHCGALSLLCPACHSFTPFTVCSRHTRMLSAPQLNCHAAAFARHVCWSKGSWRLAMVWEVDTARSCSVLLLHTITVLRHSPAATPEGVSSLSDK